MADFTFLFNRKGALYPVDFKSEKNQAKFKNRLKNDWPLNNLLDSTLVNLCSKVLVNLPAKELDRILNIIPAELFIPLFKASLYPVRDNALDIIINKWPYKCLKMSNYLSNMFSSLVVLYSDIEMGHRTRLGVKYSADVVHSFIDALRNRKTKLRYLDVTGLPVAEIIIKYVATHCRLAQKEYQRNCLIDEYLQNVNDLENLCDKSTMDYEPIAETQAASSVRSDLKKTTSLPDEKLVFKFDCILQERSSFEELMGALEANAANKRFCMQVCKLDLLCLGKSNIIKLLDKLEVEHIEGLRLQYNSITEESIKDILPYISQLQNLRALDLSCNLIDYRQNPEILRTMAETFGNLKHLNRLDLSSSPLGGCLAILLSGLQLPLQYLSLHSCGLTDTDLFYLANSKHILVEHLDLSENRLSRFSDALIVLLKKCAPNLNVLELDDNSFDCIDYLTIICVARKMPNLKLLATKGTFEVNDHLLAAEFLQHSNSLVAWRISLPIDVYDPNETDIVAQEAQKRIFVERVSGIIKEKFKIVVNELFF